MKKVVLVSFTNHSTKKVGIGAYVKGAEETLENNDKDHECLWLTTTNDEGGGIKGFMKWVMSGVIRPAVRILRQRKERNVYHATHSMVGYLFLFVKGKRIVTFHHMYHKSEYKTNLTWYKKWKVLTHISLLFADKIIAISPQSRDELIEYFGISPKKVVVILNKIDPAFTTLNDIPRERTVGCVSTLLPRKNVAALIRSFSLLIKMDGMDDVRLRICGKGREKESLTELAASLGLSDRVEFLSDLSAEELVRFYNSISVLATPSLHEGFGNVTIEAQRCSAPVVFFGHAEIPKEVTKCSVPCENEDDLAEKMRLLMTDEAYRERIVKAGKEYSDAFAQEHEEALLKLYNE